MTKLRHEFERKANEIQKSYDQSMKRTRDTLDKIRIDEIKAIEERKLDMIEKLMADHQKAFDDIKIYYNDITQLNLDYIKSLKDELAEAENSEHKVQIKLREKTVESKKLLLPLQKMKDDLKSLEKDRENYEKEKKDMRKVKAVLSIQEQELNSFIWQYETLLQRFDDLKKERDDLRQNLYSSVFDVKQKCAFRGLLLEKKLNAMYRIQEEREAQLNEVLVRANLDPGVLGQVKGLISLFLLLCVGMIVVHILTEVFD
jgi:chromosome segregation ATPase